MRRSFETRIYGFFVFHFFVSKKIYQGSKANEFLFLCVGLQLLQDD